MPIILMEPVCWGLEHVPVNAGVVQAVRSAYSARKVIFLGEARHVEAVRSLMPLSVSATVQWETISVPERKKPFKSRFLIDLARAFRTFWQFRRRLNGTLVLLSFTPAELIAVKIAHLITRSSLKVCVFFHANARYLVGWRSRNPFLRMMDTSFSVDLLASRPFTYVVLEQGIKESLCRKRPSMANRLSVFEHPVPSSDAIAPLSLQLPILFAFIGSAEETKGFGQFVAICDATKSKVKAEFHCIGHFLSPPQKSLDLSALDTVPASTPLDRDAFLQRLKSVHFVVMPYELEHYEFCASGALLDAIAYRKPIIARRLPIFENLAKRYGDIGYLCDTLEDMLRVTIELAQGPDPERYMSQLENIGLARLDRSPESLAVEIRAIINPSD